MDFVDRIAELATRASRQLEYCATEEATKNALVLPFIQALGYDVFNALEVLPEINADFGIKKGEKVDYAILRDGQPVMLFECKKAKADLGSVHASQLYRYFSVLHTVRIGILTNGVDYWFHSDLDAPNRMDDRPFFTFNLFDYQERHIAELKKFTKSAFNLGEILESSRELKYTAAITQIVAREFEQPSENFVSFLAKQVYSGRFTPAVKQQFREVTRKALRRYLNDSVNERLKSALEAAEMPPATEVPTDVSAAVAQASESVDQGIVRQDRGRGITTTEDEIEGYFAVKSILREVIDIKRVHFRDAKSYSSVLLDNNNRRPLSRFYFNRAQKYLGLFGTGTQEQRVPISDLDDIYNYAPQIIAAARLHSATEMPPAQNNKATKTTVASKPAAKANGVTGLKLRAFEFQGRLYPVGSWREALLSIIELARRTDQGKFQVVTTSMQGRKRPYFSKEKSQLRAPQLIPGTDLYVETNLSSQMIAKICQELMKKMGLASGGLNFLTEGSD